MTRIAACICALTFVAVVGAPHADAQKKRTQPRSVKALAKYVVASLSKSDVKRYLKIAPTLALMQKHCPGMPMGKEVVDKLYKKLTRGFNKCLKTANWKLPITKVTVTGGGKKRAVKRCTGVWELKDIHVTVARGRNVLKIEIDDPYVLGGKTFGAAGRLRCTNTSRRVIPRPPG